MWAAGHFQAKKKLTIFMQVDWAVNKLSDFFIAHSEDIIPGYSNKSNFIDCAKVRKTFSFEWILACDLACDLF